MTKQTKKKSAASSSSPHDSIFRFFYSRELFALELIQLAFTEEEIAAFNWSEIKAEKDTFDNQLRADAVFSVPFKNYPGRKAKFCILIEHKIEEFRRVFYHQLLSYQNFIIGQSLKQTDEDCLVASLVFYHGKKPWKWPKSFKKGFWGRILSKIPSSLAKDVLDFRPRIIDTHDPKVLRAIKDKRFKSRACLNVMKEVVTVKSGEEEKLKWILSLFEDYPGNKEDLALNLGDYIWAVVPGMTEELWKRVEQEAVNKGIFPKGGYMNIREQIKEEGRQEGWQKGRQEGKQEGKQEGILQGILQGQQEGRQEGRQENMQQVILNMLQKNVELSFISEVTGLTPEELKKLQTRVVAKRT